MSRKKKKFRLKDGVAAAMLVIALITLVFSTGLIPLALAMGPGAGIGAFEWTAELTPLSKTQAQVSITTNYVPSSTRDITGSEVQDWVNVRYDLEDTSAGCCHPMRGDCVPGWTKRLPSPIGDRITDPGTYHYTIAVEEGKPIYIGLWLSAVVDPRTGIPLGGNEPYCSGSVPGEFSGGAFSFSSTLHWMFPDYEFVTVEPEPTPEPEPVTKPTEPLNVGMLLFSIAMFGGSGVVFRYG